METRPGFEGQLSCHTDSRPSFLGTEGPWRYSAHQDPANLSVSQTLPPSGPHKRTPQASGIPFQEQLHQLKRSRLEVKDLGLGSGSGSGTYELCGLGPALVFLGLPVLFRCLCWMGLRKEDQGRFHQKMNPQPSERAFVSRVVSGGRSYFKREFDTLPLLSLGAPQSQDSPGLAPPGGARGFCRQEPAPEPGAALFQIQPHK